MRVLKLSTASKDYLEQSELRNPSDESDCSSGGFSFLVSWPPHTRPWPIRFTPPALLNIFAYATELAPTNPPLAFAVTPPGGFDYVLRTSAMGSGGFLFLFINRLSFSAGRADHPWSAGAELKH